MSSSSSGFLGDGPSARPGGDTAATFVGEEAFRSSFEKSLSLIAWCANCSRFELIAATLNDLVRDLVDHLLDEQAQVTSATEI